MMANRSTAETVRASDPGPPPAPRWVKVFGTMLAALVLAVAVMVIHGSMGGHGPFNHGQ
ncbi:MAG: hypothetical protein ABR584_04905 [Candidatus Baltobacteraceae bacterium]